MNIPCNRRETGETKGKGQEDDGEWKLADTVQKNRTPLQKLFLEKLFCRSCF
jgi:hypothetical protein